MKIYRVFKTGGSDVVIKKGLTNHDYKITGRKEFWIWVNRWDGPRMALPLIIGKESIQRMGKRGELRFIEISRGEFIIKRDRRTLDATCDEKEGAIVFWDSAILAKRKKPKLFDLRCWDVCPEKIETKKSEIVFKDFMLTETVVCIIYPNGWINAFYATPNMTELEWKKACLKFEDKILKFTVL